MPPKIKKEKKEEKKLSNAYDQDGRGGQQSNLKSRAYTTNWFIVILIQSIM